MLGAVLDRTSHPQHLSLRKIWNDHAENTQAVFLGNPRLSKPERARVQAAFDRATRVVAEIDATGHADGSPLTTHDHEVEARVRAAMRQLLAGPFPDGLKGDVKSLCTLAGVPRATLYRNYPDLRPSSTAGAPPPGRPGSSPTRGLPRSLDLAAGGRVAR
ncbi:hypothetical protein ABZ726_19260 [Streptomyces hundungensis]|uniref:hypothetical protein n=1 Tax=Streptomyces hundungensis TaxID=1077946 RepID=UPI0033ECDB95